jgi:hypothetical protein
MVWAAKWRTEQFTKLRTEQFIREEMEQTANQGTEYG